ncbi:hypothetical protein AAVH_07385 [Aphelenchoides avenae]|nr:hypothetical protein AAVH_07385 [Aphelenchus avenae]
MDMVDLAVNHLRPTSFDAEVGPTTWNSDGSVHNSDCLTLLNRDSFRGTLQTCQLGVFENAMPAPGFIINDGKGFLNYYIRCHDDGPGEWIDRFIDSFVSEGTNNEALESVELSWDVEDRPSEPKRLRVPSKTDVPRIAVFSEFLPLQKKPQQQLEVFAWTVDWEHGRIEAYLLLFQRQ